MANCFLVTTAAPVNQGNFDAASTMNAPNYPFTINQPFSIHYTEPITVQAQVEPQYYFYLPTQLNFHGNQYLLIDTMNSIPSSYNTNMQVSSSSRQLLYGRGTVETMAVPATTAYTVDYRNHFEQYNIFVNDTL